MRLLFGALILLTLFSAAALWQRSWMNGARSSREPYSDTPTGHAPEAASDGWSRVVLGRPSGGEPYVATDQATESEPGVARGEGAGVNGGTVHESVPATRPPPVQETVTDKEVTVTVRAGQTLSEICHERYGTARLELVQAVARYNHLSGPDEIREGQQIVLPAPDAMSEKR